MEVSEQTKLKKIIKREREKKSKRHKLLYREAIAYLEKFPSSTKWLTKIKSESTKKRYAKLLFKCMHVPRSEAIPETELRKQVTEQTEEMAKQTDKIATLEEDVRKLFNLAQMLASELPDKQKKKKA